MKTFMKYFVEEFKEIGERLLRVYAMLLGIAVIICFLLSTSPFHATDEGANLSAGVANYIEFLMTFLSTYPVAIVTSFVALVVIAVFWAAITASRRVRSETSGAYREGYQHENSR